MDFFKTLQKNARERMSKSVEAFKHELTKLRTGRASPAILEGVKVDAYGTKMPINHVATITAPQPDLLLIQPFDKNLISQIEKAIIESDLGLNPSSDGKVIRVPIPKLTEERRKELIRHVKKIAEEFKQAIRNIRRDIKEELEEKKKNSEISEDDFHRALKDLQSVTDEELAALEEILESKEKEIMTV